MHGRWGRGSSGHAHWKFSPFVPMEGRQEAGLCEATPFWEERLRPVSTWVSWGWGCVRPRPL